MAKNESSFNTLLAGLAMGLIIGVLVAPRSGKETRARWRRQGERAFGDLDASIKQMTTDIKHQVDSLRGVASELAGEAREESKSLIQKAELLKNDLASSATHLAAQTGDTRDKAMTDAKRLMSEGAGVMTELERVTKHMLKLAKSKASDKDVPS